VATFPAVLIAILATKLKESPRFVAMKGVRRLLREGQTEEAEALAREYGIDTDKVARLSYIQLFQGGERTHTIWLSLSFLLNWLGVQVLIVLGTTVLTQGKDISLVNALLFLVASNALAYIGYLLHGYVGDILGRRETISIGWLLSGIAYAFMLFVAQGNVPVLVAYMLGLFFLIGPYSALFSYMGESYPTRARGTGAAFVNAMGPIGAIVGSALFTAFQATGLSIPPAAFLAGALPIFLSGLTLLGARRVKPGQALEEIST
jgi:MFS family permease